MINRSTDCRNSRPAANFESCGLFPRDGLIWKWRTMSSHVSALLLLNNMKMINAHQFYSVSVNCDVGVCWRWKKTEDSPNKNTNAQLCMHPNLTSSRIMWSRACKVHLRRKTQEWHYNLNDEMTADSESVRPAKLTILLWAGAYIHNGWATITYEDWKKINEWSSSHKSAMTPQLLNDEQYKVKRDKLVSHCFVYWFAKQAASKIPQECGSGIMPQVGDDAATAQWWAV